MVVPETSTCQVHCWVAQAIGVAAAAAPTLWIYHVQNSNCIPIVGVFASAHKAAANACALLPHTDQAFVASNGTHFRLTVAESFPKLSTNHAPARVRHLRMFFFCWNRHFLQT